MAHYNSTAVTSAPALRLTTGVNQAIAAFSCASGGRALSDTASTTIAMLPLPGGSRIRDVKLMMRGDLGGSHLVAVRDSQAAGNLYILTAATQAIISTMSPSFAAFGRVLTSSANLYIWNQGATSGASVDYKLMCDYTSNLESSST
jgi:hypothetical protein